MSSPGAVSCTIALSGELGSGKSSVAKLLAASWGAEVYSTGSAQRDIAERRGVTTLELNRLSETDATIDYEIDAAFIELDRRTDPLIVDSRLAWHFLPRAFAVHLLVEPTEGARRAFERAGAVAETYASAAEALVGIEERTASERRRFIALYGIDIFRLRNYDLVVDSTVANPEAVADVILDAAAQPSHRHDPAWAPPLHLAPGRIRPTEGEPTNPTRVAYARPVLFSLGPVVDAAGPLVECTLVAEADDAIELGGSLTTPEAYLLSADNS